MFSFITLFLITAPILILYASGYRLDFKKRSIIQTGTLFLESKNLKNADIFINDEPYDKQLNEKIFIYNLLPGEYKIKITKENYFSWEKKLHIQSSLTTFEKNIVLFPINQPELIFNEPSNNYTISPDTKNIIFETENNGIAELYLLKLETLEKELIYKNSDPTNNIKKINWAPSSKKVLLKKDNLDYLVINTDYMGKDIIDINQIILPSTDSSTNNVIWDDFSDDTLYALSNNQISKISLSLKKSELILSVDQGEIKDNFNVVDSDLYYFVIDKENEQQTLTRLNLTLKNSETLYQAPLNCNYQFIDSPDDFITILDPDKQKLVVIRKKHIIPELNLNLERIKELSATKAAWEFLDNNKLAYYNDHEINIYYPDENKTYLVNRYGNQINQVFWYSNLNYIILSFDDNIKIIDLYSTNGTRNVNQIVTLNTIIQISSDADNDYIYFTGKDDQNNSGLYKIKLID